MSTPHPISGDNQIILYKTDDGRTHVDVQLKDETVWLSLDQLSALFERDKSAISRHIKNILKTRELSQKSVVANFATTAADGKTYRVNYYNLDMIISVGYRVNSKRGTLFRIWATNVLRRHLIEGYTIHQKRLQERGTRELEQTLKLISRTKALPDLSSDEAKGLLEIVTHYTQTWLLLRKYDDGEMEMPSCLKKPTYRLTYEDAVRGLQALKTDLVQRKEASDLFGRERAGMLQGIIGSIYQTFDRKDLYPTMQERAAHLLYFVIKDHPFTDGNKRIGVFLLLLFLERNACPLRMQDTTLVALALLVAESDPKEKNMLVRLILHFIVA